MFERANVEKVKADTEKVNLNTKTLLLRALLIQHKLNVNSMLSSGNASLVLKKGLC